MPAGIGQYLKNPLLVSAMPNVLKVLPLAILFVLGTSAGASTTAPEKPDSPAKATTTAKPTGTTKQGSTTGPAGGASPATSAKAAPGGAKESAKTDNARRSKAASAEPATRPAKARTPTASTKTQVGTLTRPVSPSRSAARSARPTVRAVASSPVYRPPHRSAGDGAVDVESGAALVVDSAGQVIYAKNPDEVLPIASITKLMTALVVMDAGLPLDELITITADDKDYLRNSHSRLQVGSQLTRRELLHIALMSSENRAAAALGRTYPAGKAAFVQLMNAKARLLGMRSTHFADTTGLDGSNVSTARDLVKLAQAASAHPLIREFTTTAESEVEPGAQRTPMIYRNSNRLVRGGNWDIQLSKTGYLNEAGRCLVMRAEVAGKPLVFVFLSGPGRLTPMGDANRIRVWLENGSHTG
jgi:D-alanyl-D-alanine endopeptidase (penicillin-binding protein 7)